jgi:toxin HigB-1
MPARLYLLALYPRRVYNNHMLARVKLARAVERRVLKLPPHVRMKLKAWAAAVEEFGLPEIRKIPGYHDEPLSGDRVGQRSIRLSRGYRAFYVVEGGDVYVVVVIEVNKHDY